MHDLCAQLVRERILFRCSIQFCRNTSSYLTPPTPNDIKTQISKSLKNLENSPKFREIWKISKISKKYGKFRKIPKISKNNGTNTLIQNWALRLSYQNKFLKIQKILKNPQKFQKKNLEWTRNYAWPMCAISPWETFISMFKIRVYTSSYLTPNSRPTLNDINSCKI